MSMYGALYFKVLQNQQYKMNVESASVQHNTHYVLQSFFLSLTYCSSSLTPSAVLAATMKTSFISSLSMLQE